MRILVFQHLAVEHPGIFRAFWAEAGHQWDTGAPAGVCRRRAPAA
jgi:hypothetical protein